jgi:hypothetical protein
MKLLIGSVMAFVLCIGNAYAEEQQMRISPVPVNGYVPDELTAVSIAGAVWIPVYGADKMKGEEPFHAELQDDVWTVKGTLQQKPGYIVKGGTAHAKISKTDGRIIDVWHEK